MNGAAVNRRVLALYPRAWRDRYGCEVADLVDELIMAGETTPLRAALGLAAGAAVERCRAVAGRAVLATVVAACGIALLVSHTLHGAGATRPYFYAHPADGALLTAIEAGWLLMELAELARGRRRARGMRVGQRVFWLASGVCLVASTVLLYLAPPVMPDAAIRPGGGAFMAGVLALIAGIGLRGWSFRALGGRYFNFSIAVSPGQSVVTSGPYRVLRHPGHAGFLLACAGVGLASANWAGLAATALPPLAVIIWRIRGEEKALLAALGDRYRSYASGHPRLVPMIW
jgi:protein-S-isoprenylcysteine O-methyltransferase Ste14